MLAVVLSPGDFGGSRETGITFPGALITWTEDEELFHLFLLDSVTASKLEGSLFSSTHLSTFRSPWAYEGRPPPMPQPPPGPCLNHGQVGHWRVDCSALLRQGKVSPQSSSSTGKSLRSSGPGSTRLILPWGLQDHGSLG